MADRQLFCVIILSLLILGSGSYLGYFIFVDDNRESIEICNWMRLFIFFVQHLITLGMLVKLLYHQQDQDTIKWIFQLSLVIIVAFIGGEIFTLTNGGRIFINQMFQYRYSNFYKKQKDISQFEVNEITLYYQIMTDFMMFLVVSAIAMIILKCKSMDEEQKYEFMIDNLKSEDFVDEPNAQQKKVCAICLTDLQNQRVLKAPCQHIFHKQCLVNWLKRSTICPLCRTDIQQSLDPNSPLRSVTHAISVPVSHPVQPQPQPQPVPELTFPDQPSVANRINVQISRRDITERVHNNDEGGLTQRAVEQRSNASANRRVIDNNQGTLANNQPTKRRENNQLPLSLPIINDNQIAQQTGIRQQNNNQFTPRRRQPNSARIFGEETTPRSIYLPSPVSQRSINIRFNSGLGPKSQPLIKVEKEGEEKKEQYIASSLENITFQSTAFYPNPNQKFIQPRNFKYSSRAEDKRINEMLHDQINT